MAHLDLSIDLGSSYTTIYEKNKGIKLRQPSAVVVQHGAISKSIIAIGDSAIGYYGRESDKITIVNPISEGAIVNVEIATKMLEYYINLVVGSMLFKPTIRAVVTLPTGVDAVDKKGFETVIYNAGVKQADFINSSSAAAFGMQAQMSAERAVLVCDIGATTTDIGIVNLGGVLAGCTINIGGDNINREIVSLVLQEGSIDINQATAEKTKLKIASLFSNDATSTTVVGKDSLSGESRSMVLSSKDICGIISHYYSKIIDVVYKISQMVSDKTLNNIRSSGIYLCGGGSQIAGLNKAFYERYKFEVNVTEDPSFAVILGAGNLMNEHRIINKLYIDR